MNANNYKPSYSESAQSHPNKSTPVAANNKLMCGHHVKHQYGCTFCTECIAIYKLTPTQFKNLFQRKIKYDMKKYSDNIPKKPDETLNDSDSNNAKKNTIILTLDKKHMNTSSLYLEFRSIIQKKPLAFIEDCVEFLDIFNDNDINSDVFYRLLTKRQYKNPYISLHNNNKLATIKSLLNALEFVDFFELLKSSKSMVYKLTSVITNTLKITESSLLGPIAYIKKIELIIYILMYKLNIPSSRYHFDKNSIINYVKSSVIRSAMAELQSMMYANPLLKEPKDSSYLLMTNSKSETKCIHSSNSRHNNVPILRVDEFLFGEELEYYLEGHTRDMKLQYYKQISKQWCQMVELKALELNLTFQLTKTPHVHNSVKYTMVIGGEWTITVFFDYTDLEVNTSPYHYNQQFKTNKQNTKSVYWFLDQFAFQIAYHLELKQKSGHKHIDLNESLLGNTELLLRMIIDAQNQSFFPELLGRMDRLYYFPSINELELEEWNSNETIMNLIVNAINTQVNNGKIFWLEKDLTFQRTIDFILLLFIIGERVFNRKNTICNLLHISDGKKTCAVNHCPSTTIEFRVMQCPINAEECRLINTMFIDWFKFLHNQQLQNEPVTCNHTNPRWYEGKNKKAQEDFLIFLKTRDSLSSENAKKIGHP